MFYLIKRRKAGNLAPSGVLFFRKASLWAERNVFKWGSVGTSPTTAYQNERDSIVDSFLPRKQPCPYICSSEAETGIARLG